MHAATVDAYRRVAAEGKLPVHVFVLRRGGTSVASARAQIAVRAATTGPYERTGDGQIISGGLQL